MKLCNFLASFQIAAIRNTGAHTDARKASNFLMVQNRKFVKKTLIAMLLLFPPWPLLVPYLCRTRTFLGNSCNCIKLVQRKALLPKFRTYVILKTINVGSYALYLLSKNYVLTCY